MNNIAEQLHNETVTCNVCQQDVPHAGSLSVEGQEYLFYFCGAGCYSTWEQLNGVAKASGS